MSRATSHGRRPRVGKLARQAASALALRTGGSALSLALSLALARSLGAEGSGGFFLALTMASIAAVLGRVGLDNALLGAAARAAARDDGTHLAALARSALALALGGSLLAGLALALGAPALAGRLFAKPELVPLLWLLAPAVPLLALRVLLAELLRGLQRIASSALVQSVAVPALALALFLGWGRHYGAPGAAAAYLVASALALALGAWLWRAARGSAPGTGGASIFSQTRPLLRRSLPLYGAALLALVLDWSGTLLLGLWHSKADVARFSIASRLASLVGVFLLAANTAAAPRFAALHQAGDRPALRSLARQMALGVTLLASPLLALLLALPGWTLSWFGPDFAPGAPALVILALGQLLNLATGPVGYLLMMSGRERRMRDAVSLAALSNLALSLALIPTWGISGAAIAASGGVIVFNLSAHYFVRHELGIQTIPWPAGRAPPEGVTP